jgi:hypothetical protein
MFRLWSQSRVLLLATSLLGVGMLALIGAWLFGAGDPTRTLVTVNGWSLLTAMLLGVALALPWFREHAGRISVSLLGLLLWVPAQVHLLLLDRVFLRMGRLDRLR